MVVNYKLIGMVALCISISTILHSSQPARDFKHDELRKAAKQDGFGVVECCGVPVIRNMVSACTNVVAALCNRYKFSQKHDSTVGISKGKKALKIE